MLHTSIFKRVWSFAQANPNKIILKDANRTWSWIELLQRASDYADAVNNITEIDEKCILPILVGRNGDSVAAILGTMMTNHGFAPLSYNQPISRLMHCLKTLSTKIVIIPDKSEFKGNEALSGLQIFSLKNFSLREGLPSIPTSKFLNQNLYVLFTSGSTGVPKGVLVDYRNIENTMLWSTDILDWNPNDVIGNCTNFFFDISMFDLFTTLYFDVPLAIYSNPSDAIQVAKETKKFKITSIFGVPTFFSHLLHTGFLDNALLLSLRRIIAGGDFFPPSHIIGWLQSRNDTEIFNVWGPTETSIVNTMYKITNKDLTYLKENKSPPVGKMHPRMEFCLIDESGLILKEVNQRGEICMLGESVTKGYIGDPEQTKKSFIKINGKDAYKTQDIGYIDRNDNLFIVGRMGSTLKLSGYRIDLGEVESAAMKMPNIHWACACVVEIEPKTNNKELWIVLEPAKKKEVIQIYLLKKFFRDVLPHYMVPKRIFITPNLPRNSNGKIDRIAVKKYAIAEIKK